MVCTDTICPVIQTGTRGDECKIPGKLCRNDNHLYSAKILKISQRNISKFEKKMDIKLSEKRIGQKVQGQPLWSISSEKSY